MSRVRFDLERHCVGAFRVDSGLLLVGDPCCWPFNTPARKGGWLAFCERGPLGIWGRRNTRLLVLHEAFVGYQLETIAQNPERRTIGVDAGFIAIVDAARGYTVDEALAEDLRDDIVAEGRGVAVSSGVGDGSYDAQLWLRDSAAVCIEVEFIDDATVRFYQQTLPGHADVPAGLRPDAQRLRFEATNASGPPVPLYLARPLDDLDVLTPYGFKPEAFRKSLWEVIELDEAQYAALKQRAYGHMPALLSDGACIFMLDEYDGHRGLWTTHSLVREGSSAKVSP